MSESSTETEIIRLRLRLKFSKYAWDELVRATVKLHREDETDLIEHLIEKWAAEQPRLL